MPYTASNHLRAAGDNSPGILFVRNRARELLADHFYMTVAQAISIAISEWFGDYGDCE